MSPRSGQDTGPIRRRWRKTRWTKSRMSIIINVTCYPIDGLVVCHLPFGPTAYFTLYNVVMRHDVPDIGTMSEAFPHLIFHNFTSQLGKRVSAAAPFTHQMPLRLRLKELRSHRCQISSSTCFRCQKKTADVWWRSLTRRTSSPSGQDASMKLVSRVKQ